jgi:hypothetical protein
MDFAVEFLKGPVELSSAPLKIRADSLSFDPDMKDYVFTSDGKTKARIPSNNVLHITRE